MNELYINSVLFEYMAEIEQDRIERDVARKNHEQLPSKKRKTMLEIILNND